MINVALLKHYIRTALLIDKLEDWGKNSSCTCLQENTNVIMKCIFLVTLTLMSTRRNFRIKPLYKMY